MKPAATISMVMSPEEDLRSRLHLHLNQDGGNPSQLLEMLELTVRRKVWESFGMTFDEFVETSFENGGLGWSKTGLKAVWYLKHRHEHREDVAKRMAWLRNELDHLTGGIKPSSMDVAQHPATMRETAGKPPNADNYYNCNNLDQQGNSAEYLAARLARDFPDTLTEVKQGKYRSMHAAAKAVGIVKDKPRISIDGADMVKAAALLAARLEPAQLAALISELVKRLDDDQLEWLDIATP